MTPHPNTEQTERKQIAWCGTCGSISVDGLNFGRVNLTHPYPGWLECASCGAVGPWAFQRVGEEPRP